MSRTTRSPVGLSPNVGRLLTSCQKVLPTGERVVLDITCDRCGAADTTDDTTIDAFFLNRRVFVGSIPPSGGNPEKECMPMKDTLEMVDGHPHWKCMLPSGDGMTRPVYLSVDSKFSGPSTI